MWENILMAREVGNSFDDLSNDGLSAQINFVARIKNSIDSADSAALKRLMMDFPKADINLVSPFIAQTSDYLSSTLYDSVETLSNIKEFLKNYFSKLIFDLNYKLEDHELFLFKVVELINSRIKSSSTIIDRTSIEKFLNKVFTEAPFQAEVLSIAKTEFNSPFFPDRLRGGEGYKELLAFIISNLDNIIHDYEYIGSTQSGSRYGSTIRLGLSNKYEPHFKLSSKLSVSDFPGSSVRVYGRKDPLITDQGLASYRANHPGALAVYHAPPNRIVLVPVSEVKPGLRDWDGLRIYPGYMDSKGVIHDSIFVADSDGFKLSSKFIFSQNGFRVHTSPIWADNEGFTSDFEFDWQLLASDGIPIYRKSFYSAHTIIVGESVFTTLQETNLNLEHIEPTLEPLPNLKFQRRRKTSFLNPKIVIHNTLLPEIKSRMDGTAIVLNQLGGIFRHIQGTIPLEINPEFLNLHNGYDKSHNKYKTISKFKVILKKLDLTDSHFAKLTRGYVQNDGEFHVYNLDKFEFYIAWLTEMKSDLNRLGGPLVFSDHPTLNTITTYMENGKEKLDGNSIALIDAALQDIFGYTAFVCLLSGVMTFVEDPTYSSGYRIDFLNHPAPLQAKLLNHFVGRGLYDSFPPTATGLPRPFTRKFLTRHNRLFYWTGLFTLGFRRERAINPLGSYFIENYFQNYEPDSTIDFGYAQRRIIDKSLSAYVGNFKRVTKLNDMNLIGRDEIFNFFLRTMKTAPRWNDFDSNMQVLFINRLAQNIFNPKTDSRDFTTRLRRIQSKHITGRFGIKVGSTHFYFQVSYEMLTKAFRESTLTINTLQSWAYTRSVIDDRAGSNFYNDFDIAWNKVGLGEKMFDAFNIVLRMFNMIPKGELVKIQLYGRTPDGIDSDFDITKVQESINTKFNKFEINVDLDNPSKAIISMLTWMMLEPNIFSVVKWGSSNFLYLDIYNLFDQTQIQSDNPITGGFKWTETDPTFSLSRLRELMEGVFDAQGNEIEIGFNTIFDETDIKYYLGFHNHEFDSNSEDIISYIIDRIFKYFEMRGALSRSSNLFDLRI